MAGIVVDVETQLKIDAVVAGSKLTASVDELLDKLNSQAKSKGFTPVDMKTFMAQISVIEREIARMNKTLLKPMGMSSSTISDMIKEYQRFGAQMQRIDDDFRIAGIVLKERDLKAMTLRVLTYEDNIRRANLKALSDKQTELARESEKALAQQNRKTLQGLQDVLANEADTDKEVEIPGKPKGKGGIMGGLGQAAMAGGVAGIAAGATLALVDALKESAKQSQILNMVTGTIAKALGLLIDLILLPFLPILVWGIVNLFRVILWLGNLWGGFVKAIERWIGALLGHRKPLAKNLQPPMDITPGAEIPPPDTKFKPELHAGLEGLRKSLWEEWYKEIHKWCEDVDRLFGGMFTEKFWTDKFGVWATEWEKEKALIVQWSSDMQNLVRTFIDDHIKAPIVNFINDYKAVWDNFWKDRMAGFAGFVDWFKNGWNGFWSGLRAAWDNFKANFNLTGVANAIIRAINSILDGARGIPLLSHFVPADIPYVATGGFVAQTGLAVIHKGENVIPAGSTGSTVNHFNFYGLTNDQLPEKVRGILRQEGTRHSQ
jgi:hypothetical protein